MHPLRRLQRQTICLICSTSCFWCSGRLISVSQWNNFGVLLMQSITTSMAAICTGWEALELRRPQGLAFLPTEPLAEEALQHPHVSPGNHSFDLPSMARLKEIRSPNYNGLWVIGPHYVSSDDEYLHAPNSHRFHVKGKGGCGMSPQETCEMFSIPLLAPSSINKAMQRC